MFKVGKFQDLVVLSFLFFRREGAEESMFQCFYLRVCSCIQSMLLVRKLLGPSIDNKAISFYHRFYNCMEKPRSMKKTITLKKMETILLHQEIITHEKKFNPGEVTIEDSPFLTIRVVNFFGDVSTEVFSAKVNEDNKIAAVGCSNGEAKVYDIYEGKVLKIGNTSRLSGYPTTSVVWKPKSSQDFVACNCDGTIKWYNSSQETAYGHSQRPEISYLCGDYQCKEDWCAFGTDQNTIEIFDNQTMKLSQIYEAGGPQELEINHHVNRVFSVKCMKKDPNIFFSGGWDSMIQIWDVRNPTGSVRKICGPSITSDSLDYKDGVLLSGNYQNNNIVQLYDFGSGQLIQNLDIQQPKNSNSYCFAASFAHHSEFNLIAVALSGSNKVKIMKDKIMMGQIKFQATPFTLDFYRFGKKDFLLVGGAEGTIYCFKLQVHT